MYRLGVFTPQLKLLFHPHRILQWLNDINIAPILVEFDLSNICNHKCNFCNFSYLTDKSLLDKDTACKTVKILREMGVKAINWTGGKEPLVNKYAPNIFAWTARKGIQQGIFTNGALITDEIIEVLLTTQVWIRFSIDAGTRETYQNIRGIDNFDKVIATIKKMVRERNDGRYETQIGIGFVITPDNYTEIEKFARLIEETGADYGQFKPSISSELNPQWWIEEVKPRLEKMFAWCQRATINLYKFNDIIESQFDRSYKICYGHQFCPCIGADGKVWVCNQLRGFEQFCMGNIYQESFDKIWNGKRRQEAIKRIEIEKCPLFCKNNEINKILYSIKHPDKNMHYNFL